MAKATFGPSGGAADCWLVTRREGIVQTRRARPEEEPRILPSQDTPPTHTQKFHGSYFAIDPRANPGAARCLPEVTSAAMVQGILLRLLFGWSVPGCSFRKTGTRCPPSPGCWSPAEPGFDFPPISFQAFRTPIQRPPASPIQKLKSNKFRIRSNSMALQTVPAKCGCVVRSHERDCATSRSGYHEPGSGPIYWANTVRRAPSPVG